MTKKIWTVQEVIDRIQIEMDTEEETFVENNAEYLQYINDAIDEAEAEIHGLNEDYMLTSSTLDMVSGTSAYALPNTIYANKLKHVLWKRNSSDPYRLKRIKPDEVAWAEELNDPDPLYYIIRNDGTATGVQIEFFPTPQITQTGVIRLWYLRNAERVSLTTDLIDIPEFASFVFAYVKWRIATKEMSPLLDNYIGELEAQRTLMKTTLSNMIVDEQEELPRDFSHYHDFDGDFYLYW
jgi:hypothetical protein